jgi:hypothetical protein
MFSKQFSKIEREVMLPNTFYEVCATFTPKPEATTLNEHYRPISLISILKNSNNILANITHQHIKKLLDHGQVGFMPGMLRMISICKSIKV